MTRRQSRGNDESDGSEKLKNWERLVLSFISPFCEQSSDWLRFAFELVLQGRNRSDL